MKRFGFGKKKDKDGSLAGKVVVVGPYSVRVETLVGEGGFATIYKAVDLKTGQTFALKHMRLAAEPDAIREVQHEAKTMARLKGHPNILKLHAVAFAGPQGAETDGFMLLDFCPTTLLEVMQRCGFALDDFLVHEVFQDVCWAVAHMHKCNPPLAHRDIKAENVLKNGEGRWVICDFGSSTSRAQVYDTAAEIAAEEEVIRRTTTPAYRSPEMWDLYSRQRIDTAVDVWALGVLLYVLSFGKLPFQGDSKLSILYGKYDMPPGRPAALRSLIQDMLQVNPADRPDIFQVISRLDVLRAVLSEAGASGGGSGPIAPPAASQPPTQPPAALQRSSAVGPAAAGGAAAAASAAAPTLLTDAQMSRSAHLPLGPFPPPTPGVSLPGHPSSHSYALPPTSVSAHSQLASAYAGPLRQQAPGQGPPPGPRGPLAAGLQDKAQHQHPGHPHPGGPQAAPYAAGPNAHHQQQGHQAAHLPQGPHATYHHPQQPQQQQQAGGPQRPVAGRSSLQLQPHSGAAGAADPAEFAVTFDLPPPGAVGPRPAPPQQAAAAAGAGPGAPPVSLMDEPLVVLPPSPATVLDPPPAEWGNPAAPSAGTQPGPGLHTSGGAPPAQHLQPQQQQHPPRSQQPQHFEDAFGDNFFPQPTQPSQPPQPPQAPQPSQAPVHAQGRHRRHGSVGFGDDPVDWGDRPFAAEPPPAASQPPQQQPPPPQPPQQQPHPPSAQPLAPSTSHANGPIQPPPPPTAALHPVGQPPAARMGPTPVAGPEPDRPSLPPAAAAAVGTPVGSSKGNSSSGSRPSSQQQLPVVTVAALHPAADGLVSMPSAGGRRSLGGAAHAAASGDVVEALRAQVRQLSAHNASLEGRVAHLEELAASQGAALQRLAAELLALTRGQQQQQQHQASQPAEPAHATSGVLARAGSSVGRPVSPGPAAGAMAPWGNGYGGDRAAGGVAHGAGARPAAVPEQVLDEAAGGVGPMGSGGLLSSTDSVGAGRDVVAGSAFGGVVPSWGGTPERTSGPSASAVYPPISYQDLA